MMKNREIENLRSRKDFIINLRESNYDSKKYQWEFKFKFADSLCDELPSLKMRVSKYRVVERIRTLITLLETFQTIFRRTFPQNISNDKII